MTPFIAEVLGTCILIVFGAGVVSNVSLKSTEGGKDPKWILITIAWGFAVFIAAFITGLIACTWMIKLIQRSQLKYFSYYCFAVGSVAVCYALIA